ncbi:urease accessory protein UreD [Spongisporangium articulatum]|uniref:Urease accessory protein UreD n=1 Tax=Spongisporangium articulatum TaxID=3362603 RepID=A0ABW8AGH2_9ACTN
MKSRIEVVAELRGGSTAITSVRSEGRSGGHFAGRQTARGQIYLVGTAAGPLGGDEVLVSLRVGAGASLDVRSAAATVVYPGAAQPDSRLLIEAQVDDGGLLELAMEPTVVCAGAAHEAVTSVTLTGDAQLRLVEQVVLGRAGEGGGDWVGRTAVLRDSSPVLRHTLRSALLPERSVVTLVDTALEVRPATTGHSVAMPLAAGGVLVTGVGGSATGVLAEVEGALALARAPVVGAV